MKVGKTHSARPVRSTSSVLLASLLALGGCVHVNYIPHGATYPGKPSDCEIEVFSAAPPERPYQEIGILEGEGTFGRAELEDVLPKFREEACKAGGDAIILQSAQRMVTGGILSDDRSEEFYAFATVVQWRD